MKITAFSISSDRTELDLTISDAASVASLRLWTDKTFKNFSKALDLSAKLTGSVTEVITITLADLGILYFDGVYFIEAEDSDETSMEYVYTLSRYKECIVDRLMYISKCNECLKSENADLKNAFMFLTGLVYTLEDRYIDEMLTFITVLNTYCNNTCSTCGKYKNIVSSTGEDIQNPSGVTVILDGGSLD